MGQLPELLGFGYSGPSGSLLSTAARPKQWGAKYNANHNVGTLQEPFEDNQSPGGTEEDEVGGDSTMLMI